MPRSRKSSSESSPQWQWYLLLAVVIFEYVRPTDGLLKPLAPLRLAGIVTLGMIFITFMNSKRFLKEESLYRWALAFWFLVSISTLFAPNNRSAFNMSLSLFLAFTAFVAPLATILDSKERVYRFFWFWVCVQTILAFFVITGGGHGPGGYLWDENDVALALNMALPFVIYMAVFPGVSTKWRIVLYGVTVLFIGAVGVTASRGGVVGLAALIAVVVLISKRPVRNGMIVGSVAIAGLAILVAVLPASYTQDMRNMDNPEDNTRDERVWSWSIGWVMYKDNPILGVGAANYPWTNHHYAHKSPMYDPRRKVLGGRAAHSVYFTLLSEMGTAGALVFFFILKRMYDRCRAVKRYCLERGEPLSEDALRFELLFKAMMASGVTFLVTGAFISVLYYPPFWHLVGLVAATYRVARKELPGFDESTNPVISPTRP